MAKAKLKVVNKGKEQIKNVPLTKFANRQYYDYGVSVNEDRAIPSGIDGHKPVARRLLWAAFKAGITTKTKKSARIIGDTIGKYHPHGDSAAYEALVNMVNSPKPMFDGEGNFGRFSDPSYAAMRYTNAKVSKYAMKVFFDSFYLPTIEMVSNFDGEEEEPVILPSLMPNFLLNGNTGIGVGMSISTPSFSIDSVAKSLEYAFNGHKLDEKYLAKTLKLVTKYGATYDGRSSKKEIVRLMKTGKGRVMFKPVFKLDEKKKTITVTGFAQNSMEKAIEKLIDLKGIGRVDDISGTKNRFGILQVTLPKSSTPSVVKTMADKVEKALSSATTFDMKVTHRSKKGEDVEVKLQNISVLEAFERWIEYRIDIEKKATEYWIAETDKKIRFNELLRLAVANVDKILKALKEKHKSREALNESIAKLLKIKIEEAEIITGLQVYRLTSMEDEKIVATIKELEAKKKGLQKRNKKPAKYIASTMSEFAKL